MACAVVARAVVALAVVARALPERILERKKSKPLRTSSKQLKGVEQRGCPSPPAMVGIHWGAPARCVSSATVFGEKQRVWMFVGIALPDTPLPMDQVLQGRTDTQAGHLFIL